MKKKLTVTNSMLTDCLSAIQYHVEDRDLFTKQDLEIQVTVREDGNYEGIITYTEQESK